MRLFVAILFVLCGYTVAQFPYFGKCPSPEVQENFDMKRFEGRWFEIERTISFMQMGSECTYSNFSDAGYDDGSIELINVGRTPLIKITKQVRVIATVPDKNEPAKMKLRVSDLPFSGNFWVLSTDYDNYAILWSCNDIWLGLKYVRTENLWVKSRTRQFTTEIQEEVNNKLKEIKNVKGKKSLRKVTQDNCDDDDESNDDKGDNE